MRHPQDIIITRSRLSLLANSAKVYSDFTNDNRISELLKLNDDEWEDTKDWANNLSVSSYNDNIRDMCETIQMLRDLQY